MQMIAARIYDQVALDDVQYDVGRCFSGSNTTLTTIQNDGMQAFVSLYNNVLQHSLFYCICMNHYDI